MRLGYENGKPRFSKEFYFLKISKDDALKKAMSWRNETAGDNLLPCRASREDIILKNNKTGVPGVNRRVKNGQGIYTATWYDENKKLQKMQFSESTWTAKQAFFMAWATRIEKDKIFKKNKYTKSTINNPEDCFDIVYDKIGRDMAEEAWEKEKKRVSKLEDVEESK